MVPIWSEQQAALQLYYFAPKSGREITYDLKEEALSMKKQANGKSKMS